MISSRALTTPKGFRRADARPPSASDYSRTNKNNYYQLGGYGRDLARSGDFLSKMSKKGIKKGPISLAEMTDSIKLQRFFVDVAKKIAQKTDLAHQFVRADQTGVLRIEPKEDWVRLRMSYEEDVPSKALLAYNLLEKQCEMTLDSMKGEIEVLKCAGNLAAHFENKKRIMAEIERFAAAPSTARTTVAHIPAPGSDDDDEDDEGAGHFGREPIATRAVVAAGAAGGLPVHTAPAALGADGAVALAGDARMDVLALAAGAPPGGDGTADEGDGGEAQRSEAASRLGSPERAAADDARREARQVTLQLEDIEQAEAAAIGAHRQAQIERIKSAAMAKMADIRNKSGLGVFDSYDDLLRDV
jgi:hypothetical protein